MTSRSVGRRHHHHAGDREEHQRVGTRPRASRRARWPATENAIVRRPTTTSVSVTNRPKLSAWTMPPKLTALRFQSTTHASRRERQADDAEAANRHPLVRPCGTPRPPWRPAPPASRRASERRRRTMKLSIGLSVRQPCGRRAIATRSGSGRNDERLVRRCRHVNHRCRLRASKLAPAPAARRPSRTAGSIGFRNSVGTTPMTMRQRDERQRRRPLTRRQVRQRCVLLVRDLAVVHALHHPQHVDGRQDHAESPATDDVARIPRGSAEHDQELADEAVQRRAGRSTPA